MRRCWSARWRGRVSLGTLLNSRDDLSFNVAATWLPTARFDQDDQRGSDIAGNRIPYAPKAMLNLGTTFAHRSGLTIGSTVEVTGSQFADDENTVELDDEGQVGVLPSYTVVSAFAAYQIPKSRVTLRTSVRNPFDNVYITQKNEGIHAGVRRFVRGEVRWAF
jgi:outer membrane receptor protein involved in Fe transport